MIPHAPGLEALIRVRKPATERRPAKLHKTRYFFFGLEVEKRTAQDIQDAWSRLCSEEGVDKAKEIWGRGSGYPMHRDQLFRNRPIANPSKEAP